MSSLAFLKYCGAGFGEDQPVPVGQRVGVVRSLERSVVGYTNIRRELDGEAFHDGGFWIGFQVRTLLYSPC